MPTFFTDDSGSGEFLDENDPKNRIKKVRTDLRNLGIDNASTKEERDEQEKQRKAEFDKFINNPIIKAEIEATKRGETPTRFRKRKAKNGFMGTVNTNTIFTVGEQKRKEFVSVKPKKNDFDKFSVKKKKNIFDVGF